MNRLLTALLLVALSFTASAEMHLAQYGVQYVAPFKLYNADGTLDVDEADGGTEVSVRCQGGTNATATNDFVDKGSDYEITLTATEMQCATVIVTVAATTIEVFAINTVNNASAAIPQLNANVTQFGGSAGTFSGGRPEVNTTHAAGTAWGSGAITAASIATDAIGAAEIAADAIGAAEVANATIDAATFASGAIDATAIATDAIGAAEIAADAIAASEIATDAIGAAEVAADAIGASEIAANALTTAEIATGAISSDEVADGAIDAGALADAAIDNAAFACSGAFPILGVTDCGTAQAATGTTLQARSGATFADDEVIGQTILISGGSAGVGQSRTISDNVGSTDTLTVPTWTTTPTGTVTYVQFGTAAASGGGSVTIAAGGITSSSFASGAIDATAIAADAIGASELATDAIGAAELAADAIGASEIAANALTTAEIATGAISSDEVADNAIDAGALASDAITAAKLASDVTTELQTGLATAAALATVDTVADTIQATTDKLDDTLELDSTVYRFTLNALEQAPAGGGGGGTDWNADEKTAIRSILGVPASGTTPDAPSTGVLAVVRDRIGTPSNLGSGASLAANTTDIEAQTDDIGAAGAGLTAADDAVMTRLGTPAGSSVSDDIAAVEAQTDDIGSAGAGLSAVPWNAAWDAQVESEVTDAFNAIAINEPAGPPSWGGSLASWIAWIGAWSRNEINQTSTTKSLRNDADNANIATCAVSDNGTTFTVSECQ